MPDSPLLSFIFAKIVVIAKQIFVLVVDNEFTLIVFDLLKERVLYKEKLFKVS